MLRRKGDGTPHMLGYVRGRVGVMELGVWAFLEEKSIFIPSICMTTG